MGKVAIRRNSLGKYLYALALTPVVAGLWLIIEMFLFGNHGPLTWLIVQAPGHLADLDPVLGVHLFFIGIPLAFASALGAFVFGDNERPQRRWTAIAAPVCLLLAAAPALLMAIAAAGR